MSGGTKSNLAYGISFTQPDLAGRRWQAKDHLAYNQSAGYLSYQISGLIQVLRVFFYIMAGIE